MGLYARLSFDLEAMRRRKEIGEAVAIELGPQLERQREDGEELASRRGWTTRLYPDESASAYKRRVKRANFEKMLEDLRSGIIAGVVVYDIDRLARQPQDLERLIELYEANPKLVFGTCQGEIDLSTPDGRFMARILVNVANKASADAARRGARAHRQKAMAGIPVGGKRPFGWQGDKITLDTWESWLIQEAAKAIIRGKGLTTIAREWNESEMGFGSPTPSGKPWSKQVLREVMLSPRLVGYRVYRGEIARDASGEPVKGLQEAILTLDTWEAVRAVLTDPARSGPHVHTEGRKYMLSGIARCGLCSGLMRGNADKRGFNYQCNGCKRVAINGPKTDAFIEDLVLRYLKGRLVSRGPEVFPKDAQLKDVTNRIAELMDGYTSKLISGAVVFPAVAQLEREQQELRSEHTAWLRGQVKRIAPDSVLTEWPRLQVEQRRKMVQSVIQAVVVSRAVRRGPKFDDTRIEVVRRE